MARKQNNSLTLSLESLEGKNLTTSLGAAATAVSAVISPPPAQVSMSITQQTLATHNYAVQTGFFMR